MADERYDVAVIGGGASGLAAAIAAARAGARVAVLERDVACGLTILATGNGRCNLGNARLDPARYRDPVAARAVMGERPEAACAAFFDSLGIMTCEIDGRLYPVTRRAESVRDALLAAAARAGAAMRCGCEVRAARWDDGAWELAVREPDRPVRVERDDNGKLDLRRARKALGAARSVDRRVRVRRLIIAVGGSSEGMCRMLGLPHDPEAPVLCPVACHPAGRGLDAAFRALDGLRVEGALSLARGGGEPYREEGEVLFRVYGLSGIAAFDLSRRVQPDDVIELDLFPGFGIGDLIGAMRHREGAVGAFDGSDPAWFDGMLARPLAAFVAQMLAGEIAPMSDGLRGDALTRAAKLLKAVPFEVEGLAEARQAQVRRGGVPLGAVDPGTLELRAGADTAAPGIHVCGEAFDQDADCGGFNLAWAWLSGLRAGRAAAKATLTGKGGGAA